MKARDLIVGATFLVVASLWAFASAHDNQPKSITLPATVKTEVFTNVVESSNEWRCPTHGTDSGWHNPGHIMLSSYQCKYEPATARYVTSNIVKRITLTIEWNGRQLKDVTETNLFSKTTTWTLNLNPEWKETK